MITGSVGIAEERPPPTPSRSPSASACEAYREIIEAGLERGRNAMAIWQDLVTDHGFGATYASVMRYVVKLRGTRPVEARVVIRTAPGEESQVDYGEGPMVRVATTGKYRRTRLFILTLGYSRKSVRLLTWRSSSRIWAELHEQAFRRLGGATRVVVLDNLREGVLRPDAYDPTLNPLYADMLKHYGATALPCRVRDPDRKGKTESAVGHTQRTPLRGMRFETIEEAQTYLDRWDANWADKRIHGTTKRQVAAMFEEERPHLLVLPIEPFRYYQYGDRTVQLNGHVEVEGAYYAAPPGMIGARLPVQWDGVRVRLLDGPSGHLLREHLVQHRGGYRTPEADKPTKTPPTTLQLLARTRHAGRQIGCSMCRNSPVRWRAWGETHPRRAVARKETRKPHRRRGMCCCYRHGRADLSLRPTLHRATDCAATLAAPGGSPDPRADPVPRHHQQHDQGVRMNLVELQRALRQLRLGGMAAVLEARLLEAQANGIDDRPRLDARQR